jgi:hypothetical protein
MTVTLDIRPAGSTGCTEPTTRRARPARTRKHSP